MCQKQSLSHVDPRKEQDKDCFYFRLVNLLEGTYWTKNWILWKWALGQLAV
jgi:hypothetical protein